MSEKTQALTMIPIENPFLTAEWRQLVMLNYLVDPEVLRPNVPAGTVLDEWQGQTFASIVGFLFLKTRVLGVGIPFHRNFEEVNLRFYVRRRVAGEWRRGVVFVKEVVPRAAIAWTARVLYGENYVALPMRHHLEANPSNPAHPRVVSYAWRHAGRENFVEVTVAGEPEDIVPGSNAEFITEHYWGYARRRDGSTTEYRVEHPRWRASTAISSRLDCDVAALYGARFVEYLTVPPASAFLADGSEVAVLKGVRLPA